MPRLPDWLTQVALSGTQKRVAGAVGAAVITMSAAAWIVVHNGGAGAGEIVMLPAAPSSTSSRDAIVALPPVASPTAGASVTSGGPVFNAGFWRMITDDTARSARGQLGMVEQLEAALRRELERLLAQPPAATRTP